MKLSHRKARLITLKLIDRIGLIFRVPRGVNPYNDLQILRKTSIRVVFDVGANVGQSAAEYLKRYPQAAVYSFEPVQATFQMLISGIGRNSRFHPRNIALGNATGTARMMPSASTDMAYVSAEGTEVVQMATLDQFCKTEKIDHIDLLKIDTEGHDLEVLRGAENMLFKKRISIIQVEAGISPDNNVHVKFERLKGFLEDAGYLLFGLYNQVLEWPIRAPHLRRVDAVFISSEAAQKNTPCY